MTDHDTERDNGRKEGTVRLLTPGEIQMAKTVFRNHIDYSKVRVHHGSYLPFGWQKDGVAMTPNGELYFRHWYRDDFSQTLPGVQNLFIHEMSHVWQREKGMSVIMRGLVSGMVSYKYALDGRPLNKYRMEQQAQIIADNFSLQKEGYYQWLSLRLERTVEVEGDISEGVIRRGYKIALRGFPW